jgi:drug/metabolite transporter (DMT)-like permease
MLGAAFSFAVMGLAVKLASHWLPTSGVVFWRSLLSWLLIAPFALRQGAGIRTPHWREHLLRAGFGVAAMLCFFFAIDELGLAEALLLNYSLPLFLPLVERLWLREAIPAGLWRPLLTGALGLALILKPGIDVFRPAALVGLLGAVLGAAAQVGVRGLTRKESALSIVWYFSAISSLLSVLPAAHGWVTPPPSAWPSLLGMMLFGTVAQLLMTRAYALAPAGRVGPFIYASVAFAALFDWLVFQRRPNAVSAAGAALIVIAGVMALRLGRTKAVAEPLPITRS